MHWIAPSEKDPDHAALERRLWDAADQFRANSGHKSQENSAPVLGLIFLCFAEVRFAAQRARLEQVAASSRRGSRLDEPAAYHAQGILYLPAEARFDYLLNRPETGNIEAQVNGTIVPPSFRLIYKPHLQIQNLRRTRDLLPPRLLSGQVEPKPAELTK